MPAYPEGVLGTEAETSYRGLISPCCNKYKAQSPLDAGFYFLRRDFKTVVILSAAKDLVARRSLAALWMTSLYCIGI